MFVRWRPIHLGLLLLQAFWLNVVLPGHQRGLVLLPGPALQGGSHCAEHQSSHCCTKKDKSDSSDRKARCAVCAFAARLTVPPAPMLAPTPLELRPEVASGTLATLFSSDLALTYWGRGPPTA